MVVSTEKPSEDGKEGPEVIGNVEPSADEDKSGPGRSKKGKKQAPGLTVEQIQKKKEVLIKILKFGSHKERKEAMREVVRFPLEHAEELYQIVSQILSSDADMGVRISCLKALSDVNYKKEPEVIVATLNDKNEDVKEAAIFAVQKLKLEEAGDELVKLLKDQDFSKNQTLTNNAIAALSELESGKKGSEFLESKFREKATHTNVRSGIALYFGKIKDVRSESALQDVLVDESEDPMTRERSIPKIPSQN